MYPNFLFLRGFSFKKINQSISGIFSFSLSGIFSLSLWNSPSFSLEYYLSHYRILFISVDMCVCIYIYRYWDDHICMWVWINFISLQQISSHRNINSSCSWGILSLHSGTMLPNFITSSNMTAPVLPHLCQHRINFAKSFNLVGKKL